MTERVVQPPSIGSERERPEVTSDPLVKVEGLGKRYSGRWVFRGVSFQLSLGDRLVVTGRNGAGKSTLLRIVAGLDRPSEGHVALPPGEARQTVGLSALEQALYPQLTVIEHLKLAADLRSCEARSEELLNRIGLGYAAGVQASHLSTGMKARLKLALAIQARPILLLLDEPGAGLDEAGQKLVEGIIDEQSARGCVMLATNDSQERRFANVKLELAN